MTRNPKSLHGKHKEGYERPNPPNRSEGYVRPNPPNRSEGYVRPNPPKHRDGYKKPDGGLFAKGYFIAWDGEGVTRSTPHAQYENDDGTQTPMYSHDYVYLSNSVGGEIFNLKRSLLTVECFELLLDTAKRYKNAIHVIFSGSYDVNMMLIDLPVELLRLIHAGEQVSWGDYEVAYTARKSLTVKRWAKTRFLKNDQGKWVPQFDAKITLWDTFGFFQGSFVSALKAYNFDPDTITYIKSMKKLRGSFTESTFRRDVIPYCKQELKLLVDLMELLRDYLRQAKLPVARWDGAGAVAASLLRRENVKSKKGEISLDLNRVSQFAYSGGRIECLQFGNYQGTVYHYDINSAYPSAMTECPDLSSGVWLYDHNMGIRQTRQALKQYPFSLYHIRYRFPPDLLPLYPFSHRDELGQISYPNVGENWVWAPELSAALETIPGCGKYIAVEEAYCYFDAHHKGSAFAFLPDLFQLRRQWKKEGRGAEKVLKLGYNSLYGKTIQKQGYKQDDGERQVPPYFQLQWAGYITSKTRALLFRAAMQAPDKIIMIATDGIFSTVPLKLDTGSNLGQWEESTHTAITVVQSGVYFYDNPDGSNKEYYRGFDEGTITREKVLDAWETGAYTLPVQTTRFITLGSALVSPKRFTLWRHWHTINRDLDLYLSKSAKRRVVDADNEHLSSPADGLYKTRPRIGLGGMSTRYELPWESLYGETIDQTPYHTFMGEVEDSYA